MIESINLPFGKVMPYIVLDFCFKMPSTLRASQIADLMVSYSLHGKKGPALSKEG